MRPSARRKTAVCLRFSSREISSTPCVRPSSVWNGMNDSGTNSVMPPVRSCSSRTTRMCSASSHGSSMWPNITVDGRAQPGARATASMISTQRATGSLFGRDALAHAVVQHLGGGARRRAEAGVAQPREHLGAAAGRRCRTCARSPSGCRRAGAAAARVVLGDAQPAAGSPRASSRGGCPTACRSRSRRSRPPRARGATNSSRSCS